jgi:hypothetical protein
MVALESGGPLMLDIGGLELGPNNPPPRALIVAIVIAVLYLLLLGAVK